MSTTQQTTAQTTSITTIRTTNAATTAQSTAYVAQLIPCLEGEREAIAMETMLQGCSSEEPFALELAGNRRTQCFLVRAKSKETQETLCQQVRAQYPQVECKAVKTDADPLKIRSGEHALVGDFVLTGPPWMPIKTFRDKEMSQIGTDPLIGVLAAMEQMKPGERIVSQLTLVRAPDSWVNRYKRKSVEHALQPERDEVRQQGVPTDITGEVLKIVLGLVAVIGTVQGYVWYRQHDVFKLALLILSAVAGFLGLIWWWMHQERPIYDQKLVAEKLLRVGYYAQLRVIVIGPEQHSVQSLRQYLTRMELAYRQYNLASANGFKLKRTYEITAGSKQAHRLIDPARAFQNHQIIKRWLLGGRWNRDVLNAREASGMYHLPQQGADLPLVQRLSVKRMLASPRIARQIEQEQTQTPPVLVGYSEQRGHRVAFYFPESALFSHKFFIARSQYGKSTLMQMLVEGAMQPIRPLPPGAPVPPIGAGKQPAVVVVDPHGDLVSDIMRLPIAHERKSDILLIDLSDTDYPPGINLLDAGMGFTRDQAVANMMTSFAKTWADFWGPRMSFYLSHVLLTLFCVNEHLCKEGKRHEQYTLLDVNPILQQPEYARSIIAKLDKNNRQEMELLSWWRDTYFKLPNSGNFKQEIISPILSKMAVFSDKLVLQRIVGQPTTTVNLAEVINDGKICLISLASKDLEEDALGVLGSTLINLTHRAMQGQSTTKLAERRRVFIAVDEFQNIPGADYAKLLSEDRKYGCSMMLASQDLERLNEVREGLLSLVLSNSEQLCAFSCNSADAEILEKELHQRVQMTHIMAQPRLHCYARLTIPDQPLQIASLTLAKPSSWQRTADGDLHEKDIRDTNRNRYLSAARVDQALIEHMNRYSDMQSYADSVGKDVKKTQNAKNKRDAANKKAKELEQSRITSATPPPTQVDGEYQPIPSVEPTTAGQGQIPKNESEVLLPPPAIVAKLVDAPGKKKRTRSHNRSKRKVKEKALELPPPPIKTKQRKSA